MEVTQQVLWLFETNNGCLLPCWWGIVPGQTEWQTASDFLREFDRFPREVTLASGFTYYGVNIPLPPEIFFIDKMELGILTSAGVIEEITTDVSNENISKGYLTQYSLSSFLTTYGRPTEVWLFTYPAPFAQDELPFTFVLFYSDQGILASYTIDGTINGEVVQGCPKDEPVSFLSLWSPDLDLTFEQAIDGTSVLELDYKSLNDSTEISVDEFYESFKVPENTTCLETLADLWR
jgi:hypothetical protein